jgi:hypothetical protein
MHLPNQNLNGNGLQGHSSREGAYQMCSACACVEICMRIVASCGTTSLAQRLALAVSCDVPQLDCMQPASHQKLFLLSHNTPCLKTLGLSLDRTQWSLGGVLLASAFHSSQWRSSRWLSVSCWLSASLLKNADNTLRYF